MIVPPHPGLCSAFGAAIAPLRVDRVWSLGVRSDRISEADVRRRFEAGEADARTELERDGAAGTPLVTRSIACRYHLQNYEEDVAVADLEPGFLERAVAASTGSTEASTATRSRTSRSSSSTARSRQSSMPPGEGQAARVSSRRRRQASVGSSATTASSA